MKVKELMERVGTTNFGFTKAYINDGMREINEMMEESVSIAKQILLKTNGIMQWLIQILMD